MIYMLFRAGYVEVVHYCRVLSIRTRRSQTITIFLEKKIHIFYLGVLQIFAILKAPKTKLSEAKRNGKAEYNKV